MYFKHLNILADKLSKPISSKVDFIQLERARLIATTSEYKKFPMAAIIACKNTIISIQTNKPKSHPKQKSCKYNERSERLSTHAELSVILHAKKYRDFYPEKSTIYIARVLKTNRMNNICCENSPSACSYPCEQCWDLILYSKIKKIVCYNTHGKPVEINI